jgi:hypothetical protein
MPRTLSILTLAFVLATATMWCDDGALLHAASAVCTAAGPAGGHDAHETSGCMSDGCACACLCHAPVVLTGADPCVLILHGNPLVVSSDTRIPAASLRGIFRPPRTL